MVLKKKILFGRAGRTAQCAVGYVGGSKGGRKAKALNRV